MKYLTTLVVALGITLLPSIAAQSAESAPPAGETSGQPAEAAATPAKCLEAVVNPVTGFALCVNPRGAPVERPPVTALQPCKPRSHDKEDWAVYEHWSGCGD